MRRKRLLLLSIVIYIASYGHAQQWSGIVASNRAADWSTAGVEGGIPSDGWTQCGSTIPAGASAATIQNALNNCAANHYVLLAPGTYNLSAGLNISHSRTALRGSGADQTFINVSADAPSSCFISVHGSISMCSGSNSQTIVNWTGGYSRGTTNITLSSTNGLTVGTPIILEQLDDASDGWPAAGDLYVCESTSNNCSNQGGGSDGYYPESGRSSMQMVRVTAVNGNTVTVNPPITLPHYRAAQSPHAVYYGSSVFLTYAGVENLSLNYTGGQAGVKMVYCDNCWVKGTRIVNTSSSPGSDVHNVMPVLSFHTTIRDNYLYGDLCGTGCILNYQQMPMNNGSMLWENNIAHGTQAAFIPNGPYSNSVFSYNFFTGRPDSAVLLHNAGEMMNLVEGNIMNGWLGDVDHGTHFFETLFRNAIVSYQYASGPGNVNTAVEAHTNNRFINVVGNVIGHSHFTTYQTDQAANDNAVFNLGWQGNISGTQVTNDPHVQRTLLRWGNWDSVTNATRWCGNSSNTGWSTTCKSTSEVPSGIPNFSNAVPSTQNLPASFYLSAKPSWWGNAVPFPPIGPDVDNSSASTSIRVPNLGNHAYLNPAANCYLNIMKGAANGSGGPYTFNADSCYKASSTSTSTVPINVTTTVQ